MRCSSESISTRTMFSNTRNSLPPLKSRRMFPSLPRSAPLSLNLCEPPLLPPLLSQPLQRLHPLPLEVDKDPPCPAFITFYRPESIVVAAILVLNTIGAIVQSAVRVFDQMRMSPSSNKSRSPILTVGCLSTPVTWMPQDELPPRLVLSPNAK